MNDDKETVRRNHVMLEKNTLQTYICISITSHDESTEKIFERAKKQFEEMKE
jgi:hypothetical protein